MLANGIFIYLSNLAPRNMHVTRRDLHSMIIHGVLRRVYLLYCMRVDCLQGRSCIFSLTQTERKRSAGGSCNGIYFCTRRASFPQYVWCFHDAILRINGFSSANMVGN